MDLQGIAASIAGTINPNVTIMLRQSAGYTKNADASRVPNYAAPIALTAQVQPLSYSDLEKIDGLNLQNEKRKVYVSYAVNGIVRVSRDGGDLVTLADGSVWKVVQILEAWPNWTSFAIVLQNGS